MTRIKRDIPLTVRLDVLSVEQCYYCQDRLLPREVDHYVPLGRGGSNDRANLVAACVSCNTQKRSMLLSEWRAYRQTYGMTWPPLATHPTEPRHYGDYCESCYRIANGAIRKTQLIYTAYEIEAHRDKNLCHYRCASSHQWTCWHWVRPAYYSDCACRYCHNQREDRGHKHWPDNRLPSAVGVTA